MKYNTLKEIAEKRRSIHAFLETKIAREEIEKIVEIGALAPSGFHSQPWEIFIIEDAGKRKEIATSILQVPDYFELFEMMAIGEPKEDPLPKKLRSVREILHYNGM